MAKKSAKPSQGDKEGWQEALRRITEAKRSEARNLDLSSLRLESIPPSLATLTALEGLYLSRNKITAIPDFLIQLRNLKRLDLSSNEMREVPKSLGRLDGLRELYLASNQIAAIPDSIGEMRNLEILGLTGNRIAEISDSIYRLEKLKGLNLDGNRISSIPNSLTQLANLRQLDLSDNQIAEIPAALAQLSSLQQLYLHGNPGLEIPNEVLGPPAVDVVQRRTEPSSPKAILNYYFGQRAVSEGKLILVGQGGVGKTSLVKAVTTGGFELNEAVTLGIKICDWPCPVGEDNIITVHVWDFGGQAMLHATHRFFLTARSLYLVVLSWRKGGYDREADYWFRLIRAFGGKDAPVLVVLNKQKSEPFDVNRGAWLEKYADNIRGFAETDCVDRESISQLTRKIQDQFRSLKNLRTGFPGRWLDIKKELAGMPAPYVTFEKYREICRNHGEADPAEQTVLAGFLHDMGIALNYKDDPRLRFAYVLKPEWVTGGIYALLHAFKETHGVFSVTEAEEELAKHDYQAEDATFILGLMERFELSFPLGDAKNRIMIPELLRDQQPDLAREFALTATLNFGYQYPIVSEGLLPRFIVRTHHLSDPDTRWKSGVILRHPATRCRAMVRADEAGNQVRIHIDGPEAGRRELLAVIRHNFEAIHADYDFLPDELVYPPGVPDKPLMVRELSALLKAGNAALPVVLPDGTVRTLRIADLIEPVQTAAAALRLFLSYAHADTKYLEDLRKGLKVMERNGLLRPWYDGEIAPGEKWEQTIKQELNEADVVVCPLSPDFLASDFIMSTELDTALHRQAAGEATLIAYVLKDCLWRETKFKDFQLLPRDAKPLSEWRNKPAFWREVCEGIQAELKKLQHRRTTDSHVS